MANPVCDVQVFLDQAPEPRRRPCLLGARVPLLRAADGARVHFCGTHARMALDGLVGPDGQRSDPRTEASVSRRRNPAPAPFAGTWRSAS